MLRLKPCKTVFSDIYKNNGWNGVSRSGQGSDLEQTREVARALPGLLADLGVRVMLDAPCGDFYWMNHVDLAGIQYIGGDIVEELATDNTAKFGAPGREF